MVSRLMINLQNPAIFEYNNRTDGGTLTSGTNLGPFVAMPPEGETRGTVSNLEFSGGATSSSGSMGMLSTTIASGLTSLKPSMSLTSATATASGSGAGSRTGPKTPVKDLEGDVGVDVVVHEAEYLDVDDGRGLGFEDDEDEWAARMPRRALWYNPEWVSGYQRAAEAETEMGPIRARRRDGVREDEGA